MRKPFAPGTKIRIEVDATVIGLSDPDNPYWYRVMVNGHEELVSLARINQLSDRARVALDTDMSGQIFNPRLSPAGLLDLLQLLRCNEAELQRAAGIEQESRAVSSQVICESCSQVIDGNSEKAHVCPTR